MQNKEFSERTAFTVVLFLMPPYTMHGSQADTARAHTLGSSYTGYPELRICSNPPPASLMIPVRSSFDTGGTKIEAGEGFHNFCNSV